MPETTANLDLPLIMPLQAQKHVPVNESLLLLDLLVQARVESRSTDVQPAEPGEGRSWILPSGATGDDWSGFSAGDIAQYRDGAWLRFTPKTGWEFYVFDEGQDVRFDGMAWRLAEPATVLSEAVSGAATQSLLIDVAADALSGASVTTSAIIPARSVVFCVSATTTDAISGAASFDCGIAGEPSKFGGSLGISAGASNRGVIGPQAFYSDTPVVLTANGGDFTGGRVALSIHAWVPIAPVS